jgi:hypothetical protein
MRMTILLAGLALAACSQEPASEAAGDRTAEAEATAPAPVETGGIVAPAEPAPAESPPPSQDASALPDKLPPADVANRYVGRWAAREQLCDTGAWRFERRRLVTAGEVSCDFDDVAKAPGGYDIAATCLAEGSTSKDTLQLRFAESAQAMLVKSKMWDVGLIYCGPLG